MKTEIVEADVTEVADVPAPPQSGSLLSVIERIASSPDVDVDRMEKLLEMRAREEDRIRAIEKEDRAAVAQREYISAMSQAQGAIGPIVKNRPNEHTRSTYATLAAIDKVTTPILTKFGFSTWAKTTASEIDGHLHITLFVGHEGGHVEEFSDDFPLDIAGAKGNANKTPLQGRGSTKTYGRRYLKCEALDLSFEEDNDGNRQDAPVETITPDQFITIRDLLERSNTSEDAFLKAYGAKDGAMLEHFPAKWFDAAQGQLERKIEKMAKEQADG